MCSYVPYVVQNTNYWIFGQALINPVIFFIILKKLDHGCNNLNPVAFSKERVAVVSVIS